MARSLELILRTDGLDAGAALIGRIGGAAREASGPVARIGRQTSRLDPGPLEKIGAAAKEAEGHFRGLTTQIQETVKAYRELKGEKPEIRVPKVGATPAAAGGRTTAAQRFVSGPNQRLRELEEQEKRLDQIVDPAERAAVTKDIETKRVLAQRSIALHERRMKDPGKYLSGPGLLELFDDLNGLLRNVTGGDLAGGARRITEIGRGIGFIPTAEKPGGVNVVQRLQQAERSRTSFASPSLADFILPTSRGGAGAGALGVIAKIGPALRFLGPLAIAGTVLVGGFVVAKKAVEAFIHNLDRASRELNTFGSARTLSGGTIGNISRLQALGLAPSEIPGMAAALRERISSDPFAMMAANQLGIGVQPGRPFGDVNEAMGLERAIDALRETERKAIPVIGKVKAQEETLRLARMLQIESSIEAIRVSDRIRAAQRRDGELRERIFDEDALQSALDYAAGVKRIGAAQENLNKIFAKPFLRDASTAVNAMADALQLLARVGNDAEGAIRKAGYGVAEFLAGLVGGPLGGAAAKFIRPTVENPEAAGGALKWVLGKTLGKEVADATAKYFRGELKGQQSMSKDESATRAQIKALEDNTRALKEGMTGGGERAGRAIPGRLKGWAADQAAVGASVRYGSVTL